MHKPNYNKFYCYPLICVYFSIPSVKSFVEITRYLLKLPGVTGHYFLSERLSQDPIENYFGRQRARGGRSDNPTVKACLENAQSLCVQQRFGKPCAMNLVLVNTNIINCSLSYSIGRNIQFQF